MRRAGITGAVAALLVGLLAVSAPPSSADAAPTPQSVAARAHHSKPVLTRVTPATGSTSGGSTVVIKGKGLTEVKRVLFGTSEAPDVRDKSAKKLVVVVPAHAAGVVAVRVITKHGSSAKGKGPAFTYVATAPSLSRLSPAAGPVGGGTTVTLTGTGLAGATAVRFGAATAGFHVVSATTITATSPAHSVGNVDVTVTTPGGSTVLGEAFDFVAPPTLDGLDPDSGPTAGSTVTVLGSGFTSDAVVRFAGTQATDVHVAADGTSLTASAPPHLAGWVDVNVTTVGGSVTLTHGFLYVGGISLTAVSPSQGPAAGGGNVTLTGSGFSDDTLVTFGNKPSLDVHANGAGTSLTVLLPAHSAGTVDVLVSNEGDSTTLTGAFTYIDAPVLASVSPSVGRATGGDTVTLTGTHFRSGAQVLFGTTSATGVSVNGAGTQLTAVTPAHAAGTVDVSVTTPGGTSTKPNGYTFVAAPTIGTLTPTQGPTGGGTSVGITGTNFQAGMQVSFGGTSATAVTIDSATHATVTTPSHAAGAVSVVVSTPGGSDTKTTAFTYVAAPTIGTVTPAEGPIGGGTSVGITGTNFQAGMQVSFGGTSATAVAIDSATHATATTPAHAAGSVAVAVSTPGGSDSKANGFAYVSSPTIGSVSPTEGPTGGGTTVTLTGSGFEAGMQVTIGGQPATVQSVTPGGTQLTATTPAHAAGAVSVSVTTQGGSDTLPAAYTYVAAPTLTDVTPAAGPTDGGTTVTLDGTGFRPGMDVLFGGTPAAGVTANPAGTALTAHTPPHAAAAVAVTVTTSGGSATLPAAFDYVAAPTLTGLSPTAGPVAGGTAVTLTGTHLTAGMSVLFGSSSAAVVSVTPDATQATVTAPPHSAAVVDITVTTPGGSAARGTFTYLDAPTVDTVSPAQGPAAGGTTVTLTGSGFRAGMQVTFGGAAATSLTVSSATHATVSTPPHAAGAVDVVVTTAGGSVTLPGGFSYVAAPTVGSVSPGQGPAAGGTSVTITGTHLTGTTSVTFGGTTAPFTVTDDSHLSVTAPAHAAGAVDVVVTTPGGSATATDGFSYVAAPTVGSVSPGQGPAAGGTSVTITGTHLTGTTSVTFGGTTAPFTVTDDSHLSVTAPAHAAGAVDVVVTTPGGSATATDGFSYVAAPTVGSVSPGQGPAAGGTSVTITGTHLTGTASVTFGGTTAPFTVTDDSHLTVTTPAGTAGAADVVVTTPGGSATASGAFTYVVAPTVTMVSPPVGPGTGGTSVTITGTHLTGVTAVTFDGVPATDVTPVDDSTVTATTPAHAAGSAVVTVTTPGGTASAPLPYDYLP